jgi:hypothetical protein
MPDEVERLLTLISDALLVPAGAVWLDGSLGGFILACLARVDGYATDGFDSSFACAMDGVYHVQALRGPVNPTLLADVSEAIGSTDPCLLPRAYDLYLAATAAARDGHTDIISPTGATACALDSVRVRAVYDEIDDPDTFGLRRTIFGVKDKRLRYERIVGHRIGAGKPIDCIQRHEFELAAVAADAEALACRLAGVRVHHPFLTQKVSGYIASLPPSLRYCREATVIDKIAANLLPYWVAHHREAD